MKLTMKLIRDHPIVLFDGVCNFCNASANFILKRDPKGVFRFAPLQSEAAKGLLEKFHLPLDDLDTMVLIENGKAYTRSTAGLRIARHLNAAWPLLYGFIVLPRFFRDTIYRLIARNRYRWFGKRETCMIPLPEWKERFLVTT